MSINLEHKTTHNEEADDLFIEQFKRSANLLAWVGAYIDQIQELEDMFYDLYTLRGVDSAEGAQLDVLGSIVGEVRNNLDDDDYRVRIKVRIRLNRASGLDSDIVDVFSLILNDTTPPMELIEVYPAGLIIKLSEYIDSVTPSVLADILREARAAAVDTSLWYHTQDEDLSFRTSADASPVTEAVTTGFAAANTALGTGWYNKTFGVSTPITTLVYGNGKYVAISGSTMKYSTDLVTWAACTEGFTGAIVDLIYAGGQFVAIGNVSGTYKSATSSDGITFTTRNAVGAVSGGVGTPSWGAGIAHNGTNYVIMSNVGDISCSSDGATWVLDASAVGGGAQNFALGWIHDRFMAGTTNGGIFTSTTGAFGTWANHAVGGSFAAGKNVYGFAYHNGLYVVFGQDGILDTSPTAADSSWTARTSGFTADIIRYAYSDGTTLVLVGAAGKIVRSTNATAYTLTATIGTDEFRGVIKASSVCWIAVGDNGTIARSTDATTWAAIETTGDDLGGTQGNQGGHTCVDYLNSVLIAWGGNVATSRVVISKDFSAYGGKLAGVIQA